MKVYVVAGYEEPDYRDDWQIMGVYTSRKKAEEAAVAIAGEAYDTQCWIRERHGIKYPEMRCYYYKNKLSAIIDDYNYDICINIQEEELNEED